MVFNNPRMNFFLQLLPIPYVRFENQPSVGIYNQVLCEGRKIASVLKDAMRQGTMLPDFASSKYFQVAVTGAIVKKVTK